MKPRDYQTKIANDGTDILRVKKILYLKMQVRTGKTLTALLVAEKSKCRNVLFVTKKKAIKSVESDYNNYFFGFNFKLTVINHESVHKVQDDYDLLIMDEQHVLGAYPKPCKVAKYIKLHYSKKQFIMLSGTPTPESYSQLYHQFWISDHSPWRTHKNFYTWAKAGFVNVKQRNLGYSVVNDYSDALASKIERSFDAYAIGYTQQLAGFKSGINEMVLFCDVLPITTNIANTLKKNLMVRNLDGRLILGDTGVKLMQKLHQIYSGTIRFEDGTSKVFDCSKAIFIEKTFKGQKIAVFYKFKEELNALKSIFGNMITEDLIEFDATEKTIALQMRAGREGISLKKADALVYYNIDYSATTYWQSRDRLNHIERVENNIFYIFSKNGLEKNIYNTVIKKKNFTLSHFKSYERADITN